MTADEAKQLEADSRRTLDEPGVVHPDLCETITLRATVFYVQPLVQRARFSIKPRLGDRRELEVHDVSEGRNETLCKEAEQIITLVQIEGGDSCSQCGQPTSDPTLVLEMDDQSGLILRLAEYVAVLLRQQYTLTTDQIETLLEYEGESIPTWIIEAIRHAHVLPTKETVIGDSVAVESSVFEREFSNMVSGDVEEPRQKQRRKSWLPWRR